MYSKREQKPSAELRKKATTIVFVVAKKYNVPPVHVTAHVLSRQADKARMEAMRAMIAELGMKRCEVAQAFGRDLRRVRKSVLGV